MEIRITEPAPIVRAAHGLLNGSHQQFEHGLVTQYFALEVLGAVLREIEMGVGVVAERIAAVHPDLQCRSTVGIALELPGDDESVRGWNAVLLQHLDGVAREVRFLRSRRQQAVERQIVEGQRHLELRARLGHRNGTEERERAREQTPQVRQNGDIPHFIVTIGAVASSERSTSIVTMR